MSVKIRPFHFAQLSGIAKCLLNMAYGRADADADSTITGGQGVKHIIDYPSLYSNEQIVYVRKHVWAHTQTLFKSILNQMFEA